MSICMGYERGVSLLLDPLVHCGLTVFTSVTLVHISVSQRSNRLTSFVWYIAVTWIMLSYCFTSPFLVS